jgi:hypothetical protein
MEPTFLGTTGRFFDGANPLANANPIKPVAGRLEYACHRN